MPPSFLRTLKNRFAQREDSEHEQAIIRLVVGGFLTIYLFPHSLNEGGADWPFLAALAAFQILAWGIFIHIARSPEISSARRIFGALVDSSTVTYFMVQTGFNGLPLFPVYLWIIFGNGFRYGARYLITTLCFCAVGFVGVLALSEFWQQHLQVGLSLLLGLVVLSLYVRALVMRLSVALQRAEAANIAKRQFVSTVSHEMRTPLNAIIGMAELLRDSKLGGEQSEMLGTIDAASHTMLELVNDVLDFSKIEAGRLALLDEGFDLYATINSAAQILRPQAEGKGLTLQVTIMPDVPPYMRGDPARIQQVLINLLANAIKFTEHGSVTLHVAQVREESERITLKVSVRDTGVGIAPDMQARIFESFTQADQRINRRFGGTGLGTTIAKQLVELMGGRIGVESALGLGSTFWFELSLQRDFESASHAQARALSDHRCLLIGFSASEEKQISELIGRWDGEFECSTLKDAATSASLNANSERPFNCALLRAASAQAAKTAYARLIRGLMGRRLPTLLVLPADVTLPTEGVGGRFSAVLQLPLDDQLLFNALHTLVTETPPEGVLLISDYLKRKESARKLKLLIADDNATNRLVTSKILERGAHEVRAVDSGEAVLEALELERFDALILDRNMPGIGGIEALLGLRVMELGMPRTPVIILSADVSEEARHEAIAAGADLYLTKPIRSGVLLDAIASLTSASLASAGNIETIPMAATAPVQTDTDRSLNLDTLAHLAELGSTEDFLDRLVQMFFDDNATLIADMQAAATAKRFNELRAHAHALKGSAGSLGLDRLMALCAQLQRCQEGELRLRATSYITAIQSEFEGAKDGLANYLNQRNAARAEQKH